MRQKLLLLFIVLSLQIKANVILPDSILSSIPDSVDVSNNEALFYYSERLIGNQFFDKGYFILKQLEHEFEQEGNQLFLAKTIYNIGDYFYFKNEYDEALAVYTDVLSKSRAISDTFLIAKTLNSIGLIHAYNSDANKALNSYLEEIELINQVPYPSYALKNEKLVVLINIIGLYITRDEAENIISYAQTAINLGEELRDSIRLGSAYNLLGVGFRYNKQYEEAKKSFDKSIEIFKDLNDIYYLSFLYVNVGTLYEYLEEFETAIDYTEKGLNGFKRDNYYYGVHTALNNLANIYYKKGDYQNSKKYLLQIIEHESHEKFPTKLKDTYEYLSNTESKLGNYKNAFEYQQKFVALSDSLNNREKMEKYTELQTKFESIQKDYQINVLKTQKIEHELQLRKNKQQISIVLYIASALLIVVFLVILNLRNKRIANKKLVSQNQQIEQKNKQLSDYNDQLTDLNAQLKISQEELSDSNKTKDRFISILAHDLRNPLHNIIGQSYLLSDAYFKLSEADRIRYAKEINISTEQLSRLLDNLLEWARTQSKGIKFSPKLFDLRSVVQNVESILNGAAHEKSIALENEIPIGMSVFADQAMIETVVRNLINNGIKFTNPAGKITISAHLVGSFVITKISDNGVGISLENQERLFKLDQNLKTRGTNDERGTGLGLIICKEFIDLHHGRIWVESEVGKGSNFLFSIPIFDL